MQSIRIISFLFLSAFILIGCHPAEDKPSGPRPMPEKHKFPMKPIKISYHVEKGKLWRKKIDSLYGKQLHLLLSVNRADADNLPTLDSVLVPDDFNTDIAFYMPFPVEVPSLKNISKIIIFSYPLQSFGAYEKGDLVYTGATNMGRKKDPTPTGLFFTNWKAEQTTSTFNDEWDLKWNFNIENKEGVGWHQYAMPGYPASHSCLRLLEEDAEYLYKWADEWTVKKDNVVLAQGTPVVIYGSYNFGGRRPWKQLAKDPLALNLSISDISKITSSHMDRIMEQQKRTDDVRDKEKK